MEQNFDVLCIGFVVQDLILDGIDADALQKDSTYAENILISTGGDAANQAVVLSGLGKRTALIAGFGRDVIGMQIEEQMKKRGVDISCSVRDSIERSNLSVVVIKKNKERSFLVGKGRGNVDISLEDIDLDVLRHTKAVSLGSLYFLKNLDGKGAAAIFDEAKKRGVLTFADMTADAYSIGAKGIENVYPYTDYLLPSYEEAVYTSGYKTYDGIADFFLNKGVKTVVLKLGGKGCFVKSRDIGFFVRAFQTQPVDTTGCGDNFCAGFIFGILEGMTLKKAAEFACAAGAINAEYMGAHGGIQSREQVECFMENTPRKTIIW